MSIILTTLPKSFDQFKSNYVMNKLKFNLTQLLTDLTTFESMIKDNKSKTDEANVVEPSSSGLKKRKRSAGKEKLSPRRNKFKIRRKAPRLTKQKGSVSIATKLVIGRGIVHSTSRSSLRRRK